MKKCLRTLCAILVFACGCGNPAVSGSETGVENAGSEAMQLEGTDGETKETPAARIAKKINDENCITLKSLNEKLTFNVYHSNGEVVYDLETCGGTPVINESKLGMKTSNLPEGFGNADFVSFETGERELTYSFIGGWSSITDKCKTGILRLKTGDYEYSMEIKLYDDGVAFRYVLPSNGSEQTVSYEDTTFEIDDLDCVYCGIDSHKYQSEIKKRTFNSLLAFKLDGPITAVTKGGKYVVLLEGYVDPSCIGTYYKTLSAKNTFGIESSWMNDAGYDAFTTEQDVYTPWKLVNYSEDLAGIVLNTNIYSSATCLDTKIEYPYDASYVEACRSAFSFINGDKTLDDMYDYVVDLARLGFEYNTIDAIYSEWTEKDIKDLCDFSKKNNIKQMIWGHMEIDKAERYPYYFGDVKSAIRTTDRLKELGIDGLKVDYIHDESYYGEFLIEQEILKEAMKNEMLVSFHNSHKPVGYSVLYPNYVNCEAIKGLQGYEDNRYGFKTIANACINQFYTRCLSGMADFTPDAFNMMEVASWIAVDAPFRTITTRPSVLLEDRAVEIMKAMPASWDDTVFLDGAIDSFVSLARVKDHVWFVGGMYCEKAQDVKVDLSFLGEGEYMMTLWKDTDVQNMKKEKLCMNVTRNDSVEIGEIKAGGGYVIRLAKLDINRHGGEIGNVTVKRISVDSVVKYTLDGSDPFTSETAVICGDSIEIEKSCVLNIAVTDGDGKGTKMKYNFNEIIERNNK